MFHIIRKSEFSLRPRPLLCSAACLTGLAALALPAEPAGAQSRSREIVQPLPPPESRDLNQALRRLASNPADLSALLEAGDASLVLGDDDAALGFYRRAEAISPANGRMKLGLARVMLRRQRPVEALRLFAEAEQSGISRMEMAADRALAFDLAGDNASAQQLYRLALQNDDEGEIRRHLALSLAISGDREGFEATLLPLLSQADRAAFRSRAFGLAILGDTEQAVTIAETMLPTDLALRMAPYLRYMPRLTKAQQAAAANLGAFPRASDIGRDNARIAQYSAQPSATRGPGADLEPQGEPMGTRPAARERGQTRERRRRPDRTRSRNSGRRGTERVAVAQAPPQPQISLAFPAEPASPEPPAREIVQEVPVSPPPSPERQSENFDLGRVALQEQSVPTPRSEPADETPASVADAFADLEAAMPAAPSTGGVDISAIEPPREVQRAEPPEPQHPARHWVQVATGRDRSALRFDWRRIARKAEGRLEGKGPFVTPWGQANRLLAGPYDTAADARRIVNELKDMELDSFPFTSAEGQEIEPLQ